MANRSSQTFDVGQLGEKLVALGLRSQGWRILEERWFCKTGELDLVALDPAPHGKVLVFIEVKTRSQGNWDSDGVLAVNPRKQRKMSRTASMYLMQHPAYETWACRFDVALVQVCPKGELGQCSVFPILTFGRDRLKLPRYIRNAFDASLD